ncbi:nucleotidyltransferase substrate binding protein [bacterium]|nr:MAG: nucleotidyltransferase substrate binding protein [bacterium]
MAKIEVKHKYLCKALATLENAIVNLEKVKKTAPKEYAADLVHDLELHIRDSMIQRFEYTIENLWKYLKDYSYEKFRVVHEIQASRPIIRTCCQAMIISEQEASLLIEMIDYRNETSHRYKEEVAEILSTKIAHYYPAIEKIVRRLKP